MKIKWNNHNFMEIQIYTNQNEFNNLILHKFKIIQ